MASVSVFGEDHSTFDVSFEALDFQLLEPQLRQVIAIELPEPVAMLSNEPSVNGTMEAVTHLTHAAPSIKFQAPLRP